MIFCRVAKVGFHFCRVLNLDGAFQKHWTTLIWRLFENILTFLIHKYYCWKKNFKIYGNFRGLRLRSFVELQKWVPNILQHSRQKWLHMNNVLIFPKTLEKMWFNAFQNTLLNFETSIAMGPSPRKKKLGHLTSIRSLYVLYKSYIYYICI